MTKLPNNQIARNSISNGIVLLKLSISSNNSNPVEISVNYNKILAIITNSNFKYAERERERKTKKGTTPSSGVAMGSIGPIKELATKDDTLKSPNTR